MRLIYEREAVVHHFHPTNLALTLARMQRVGVAFRTLVRLAPEVQAPPRPSAKHRLKALTLEGLCRIVPRLAAHDIVWRFLCDQRLREAYWGAPPGSTLPEPTTGRRLAALALSRPEANPPLESPPDPLPQYP